MRVTVTFEVEVETELKLTDRNKSKIEASVAEAVHNAMLYAQGEGHNHELSDDVSILLLSLEEGGAIRANIDYRTIPEV
jgi:signal transduction histidine kinase